MKVKNLVNPEYLEGPLKGIKVVDFTHVLSGPYITSLFADMGADVCKIERADGDTIRRFVPMKDGQSGYYIQLNRGKRSLCLDLKHQKTRNIIKQMVEQADIVVENFAAGQITKLGYGYEVLSKWNPRIIMCSVSMNGQYGPERSALGFNIIAESRGGLMNITGYPDGPPTKVGVSIGDQTAGAHAAVAILAALYEREKSGQGQYIDIAMSDTMLRVNEFALPYYFMEGENPPRSGNTHPAAGPNSVYTAKDGWVIIVCVSDPTWQRLLNASEHHEWNEDPRFNTNANRGRNRYELETEINNWLSQYTMEEADALLDKHKVPHSKVFTYDDIVVNEQFKAREMLVTLEQPIVGDVMIAGNVFKFSRTPGKVQGRTALLGENNEEILKGFGFSDKEIGQFYEDKVMSKPLT